MYKNIKQMLAQTASLSWVQQSLSPHTEFNTIYFHIIIPFRSDDELQQDAQVCQAGLMKLPERW
jgi:hypothetical protein